MVSADSLVMAFALLSFIALAAGIVLKFFRQPSVIGYILTGVILGPFGLKMITDIESVTSLGNLGVIFLLFFIGLSISPTELVTRWRIAILGTLFEIILTVVVVFPLGAVMGWSLGKIVLIGFVISLSSTAVIVKILESRRELNTNISNDVLSVLVVQDLAVIPMIIVLSLMNGEGVSLNILALQIIGCLLALVFIVWVMRQKEVILPYSSRLREDPELQVLAALVFSLGIASLSGFFHLSTALGAFIAGIFIASTRETQWVQQSLEPFKVLFVALFFVSIGVLINFSFLKSEFFLIIALLFLVFFANSFINSLVFKWNGETWRTSLYEGSLLANIGEFSFVLAAIGLQNALITDFVYQILIQVIALSLIISPFWIRFFSHFVDQSEIMIRHGKKMAEGHHGYAYNQKPVAPKSR